MSGAPLSEDQWDRCKDSEGRIVNSKAVREIIFRGVIYLINSNCSTINIPAKFKQIFAHCLIGNNAITALRSLEVFIKLLSLEFHNR